MSKKKLRKNVPRVVRKLWDEGVGIDVARVDADVARLELDIDYHWETLASEYEITKCN